MRVVFSVIGGIRQGLELVKRQWVFVLLPLVMFLLAAAVTNQVYRARAGVESKEASMEFGKHLQAARSALAEGDDERCMAELRDAERVVPEKSESLSTLSQLNLQLGQAGRAAELRERSYRAALREYDGNINRQVGLEHIAVRYLSAGRRDDGRRLLRELLAEFPDSGVGHYWEGFLVLQDKGDDAAREALVHFERSLASDPKENIKYRDAQYESGVCLARLGRFKEAERVLRELLDAEPGQLTAQYELAQVLQRLNKTDEAQALLKSYQEKEALVRRRQHLETQVGLKQATSAEMLELAHIYRDGNAAGRLREVASAYAQREPLDPRGHRLLAKAYELLKQPEAAVAEEKLAAALPEVAEDAGADAEAPADADEVTQADNP